MPNHEITIHIDRQTIKTDAASLTGTQLRNLHTPPIGADRDLFLKVPGPTDDELIGDDQSVQLKDGMQFYTAPRTITPG